MVYSSDLFSIPSQCPVCSQQLSQEGDFIYCRSKKCPARLFGDVKVWIDRLGLLFWGDSMIKSLTDPDNPCSIKSVADIYRMSEDDLERHCSGIKMARKCWKVLHNNTSIPLEIVLAGLNIQNFGLSTATDVVKSGYDTVDKILTITTEQLVGIQNIGGITADQIKTGIDSKAGVLLDLASVLDIKTSSTGPLVGKKICITGDLWAPRKSVQKQIVEAGGQAVSSVSKDTSLLVCDSIDSTSFKSKKALAYGVPVICGNDLKSLLNGGTSLEELLK